MTTIDIILFCYKQEQYIEQALQSIYDQQVPADSSVRIIVADDCSPDNTLGLIKKHASESPFPMAFLPKEPNMGISKNYKRSFAATTADYVFILEGDDYWLPGHVMQHIKFLQWHHRYSMSINQIQFLDEDKGFLPCSWPYAVPYATISLRQQIENGNQLGNFSACVFRARYLKKIPDSFFDMPFADWEVGMFIAQFGPIARLKENTSVYRVKSSGQWVQLNLEQRTQSRLATIQKMDSFFNYKYHNYFEVVQNRIINGGRFSFSATPCMDYPLRKIRHVLQWLRIKSK